MPPNACAVITVLVAGWGSDKVGMRGPFMLAGLVVAAAGYVMLISTANVHVQYGGTFLVAMGMYRLNLSHPLAGNQKS